MRSPYLTLPLLLAAGCSGSTSSFDAGAPADAQPTPDAGVAPDAGPPDTGIAACPALDGEVVTFATEDGETLEGDLYTTGVAGGPAAVLLHMIPPFNDRSNYPAGFIEALTSRGITVLNVDRRGAGGSTGVANEAFTGPNGKFDAKGAVDFLRAHACAPDAAKIAIVGASNGTTTAFDYAVYAAGEASAPSPAALVFLTGGAYTETNNQVSAQRAVLDPLPILLVFSTAERAWSAGLMPNASDSWVFEEYEGGDHGTRMFTARSESVAEVAGFLQTALQ